MVLTASNAYVKYGYEPTYGTGTNVAAAIFGKNQEITGLTWMTNQQAVTQLDTVEIQDFMYGKNEGRCGLEYILSNPWIFSSVFHTPITTGTSGLRTFVWTTDDTTIVGLPAIKKTPLTMNLQVGYAAEDGNVVRNAKGAVTTSLSLKTAINDPVQISQQIVWAKEDGITTSLVKPVAAANDSEFAPYMFHHARLQLPSGTTLAQVQDLELTFNTNAEQYYGLGDASGIDAFRGLFELTGKFTIAVLDESNLQRVIDRETEATLVVDISNGQSSTNEKSMKFEFSTIGFGEHTTDFKPGEAVIENMPFQASRCKITAKNNVAGILYPRSP